MEEIRRHVPNILIWFLISGRIIRLFIGGYIQPNDEETMEYFEISQNIQTVETPVILIGGLNANISSPHNKRDITITETLTDMGVEDISKHFLQNREHIKGFTWSGISPYGWRLSTCDYICSMDRRMFKNLRIITPRYFHSDNNTIIGDIAIDKYWGHKAYITGRKKYPLEFTTGNDEDDIHNKYISIVKERKKLTREEYPINEWISTKTWGIIDTITQLHKKQTHTTSQLLPIRKALHMALTDYRKKRVIRSGERI